MRIHLTLPLMTAALIACSSDSASAPGPQATNAYFDFYRAQPVEFRKALAKSPYHLFRGSNVVFLEKVSSPRTPQGMFAALPPTVIHGDFHLQQMAFDRSDFVLDDFDTADWGPFWVDLVRMESSGMLVAHSQSLKLYEGGACVDTYVNEILGRKIATRETPIMPPQPPVKGAYTEKSPPKDWLAAKGSAPADIVDGLDQQLQREKNPGRVREVRPIVGGVGSFLTPKYMARLEPTEFVELKFQAAQPLKSLHFSPEGGRLKACERYLMGAKAFRPDAPVGCLQLAGNAWARIPWSAQYVGVDVDDFNDETKVTEHMAWMCRRLATGHSKNWTSAQLKIVQAAFLANPLLKERILLGARWEADDFLEAYRLILGLAGNSERVP